MPLAIHARLKVSYKIKKNILCEIDECFDPY